MLATLTDGPFDGRDWVFEDKFDGFRMIAEVRNGKVALYSRNGKIISQSYTEVAKALEDLKSDAVLDGELVALDANGRVTFPAAAERAPPRGKTQILCLRHDV